MASQPIRWQAEDLWLQLEPLLPGLTIEVLPEIDSSNSELMRRARQGQVAPILLIAEQQTAGRGRQGRNWHSQRGQTLMYSLGLPLAPRDWSGLSLVVGLSIAQSLNLPALGVKWPNDLWLRDDRKVGGTLIETVSLPAAERAHAIGPGNYPRWAILGTGINVVPPTASAGLLSPAAGLQELLPQLDAPTLLARILPALVRDVLRFTEQGLSPFLAPYTRWDVLHGRPVQLSDGQHGHAAGIDAQGCLRLRTATGEVPVLSGDVSVRPFDTRALPPDTAHS